MSIAATFTWLSFKEKVTLFVTEQADLCDGCEDSCIGCDSWANGIQKVVSEEIDSIKNPYDIDRQPTEYKCFEEALTIALERFQP